MNIKQIPARLGITQGKLAELLGFQDSNMSQYMSGMRGPNSTTKKSKFVDKLLAKTGLLSEFIIFPDKTESEAGKNPDMPEYWLNLAHEAIGEAIERGFNETEALEIKLKILKTLQRS